MHRLGQHFFSYTYWQGPMIFAELWRQGSWLFLVPKMILHRPCYTVNIARPLTCNRDKSIKPGFHKANFDHDNDQFWVKTKRLVGRMTDQLHNRFVFCVVVVEFAANGNQALCCKGIKARPDVFWDLNITLKYFLWSNKKQSIAMYFLWTWNYFRQKWISKV